MLHFGLNQVEEKSKLVAKGRQSQKSKIVEYAHGTGSSSIFCVATNGRIKTVLIWPDRKMLENKFLPQ